jgi:phosphate transport system permease protein
MNANPFQGPQDALPLASFRLFRLYTGSAVQMAWTYAAVLVLLVLILFVTARAVGRRSLTR